MKGVAYLNLNSKQYHVENTKERIGASQSVRFKNIYEWRKELYYSPDTGKVRGIANSSRIKKIKELNLRLAAVESKRMHASTSSGSDIESFDPDSHIKDRSNKNKFNLLIVGDDAGNSRPVTQTKNKIIKRVTFTQQGLTTGSRYNSDETLQRKV